MTARHTHDDGLACAACLAEQTARLAAALAALTAHPEEHHMTATPNHPGTGECVYCRTTRPVATLETMNLAGNLACRDTKRCLIRQAAQIAVTGALVKLDEITDDNPDVDRDQIIAAVIGQLTSRLTAGHPLQGPYGVARSVSTGEAGKLSTAWRMAGYPFHLFAGGPGEPYCFECGGSRDGIQHKV